MPIISVQAYEEFPAPASLRGGPASETGAGGRSTWVASRVGPPPSDAPPPPVPVATPRSPAGPTSGCGAASGLLPLPLPPPGPPWLPPPPPAVAGSSCGLGPTPTSRAPSVPGPAPASRPEGAGVAASTRPSEPFPGAPPVELEEHAQITERASQEQIARLKRMVDLPESLGGGLVSRRLVSRPETRTTNLHRGVSSARLV